MTRTAFTDIFNTYFDVVRNYIYYRSGDADLATDIAQETFIKVWEKQFPLTANIKGLLYKISGDLFVSSYRKQKTRLQFTLNFKAESYDDTPEERLQFEELAKTYERALAELPEKQRVVFLMHRIDQLKYHEIANSLGISVKAVEKRMGHALSSFKKILKHEETTTY